MKKVLIYLHGFLSSPNSVKAQATKRYWQQYHPDIEFVCPQLPYYPLDAKAFIEQLVEQHQNKHVAFIGSSLGGFLSTYLVQKYGGKAVLINPAVAPHRVLSDYLGDHVHPYTNEDFTLTEQHMHDLESMYKPTLSDAENFWVLVQKGDETLDYREAESHYKDSKLTIEEGGDHAFQGYERFLPQLVEFLYS